MLPVRNAADTLAECLESIGRQTLRDHEVVVVDDGSVDGTGAILEVAVAADVRVRVVRPGRVGLVAALNLGVALARSPLIARMDADDVMHPGRLEAQVDFLARNPDIALVGCRVEVFPASRVRAGYREYVRWQNACVTPEEIADNLYVESPLAHPSVTVRRTALERVGGYHEGPFPEDYELWLRLHESGFRMAKLPSILLRWRDREERTSRVDSRYSRVAFDRLRSEYLARDPRVRGARRVVVWGAGRRTRMRARHAIERGVDPVAWIDIDPDKIDRWIGGRPVHSPEWLSGRPRPFVLVYVSNHGARDLIAARLEEMGYRRGHDYLAVG